MKQGVHCIHDMNICIKEKKNQNDCLDFLRTNRQAAFAADIRQC